jgi:N-acetylmuramic acid 6-phosphate etherase
VTASGRTPYVIGAVTAAGEPRHAAGGDAQAAREPRHAAGGDAQAAGDPRGSAVGDRQDAAGGDARGPVAGTGRGTARDRPLIAATTCAPFAAPADHRIETPVGAEVISGSTRLKAGTAQKFVLNAFSTAVMVRRGRTYGNLMAGMRVANDKLRARAVRVCVLATGCREEAAAEALKAAGDDVGQALVMLATGVDAATARARLDASHNSIRQAVEKWS